MKIGLLTAHASRRAGGVWVSVAQLGKALAGCGLDVEIYGLADEWSAADRAGWDGPPSSCTRPEAARRSAMRPASAGRWMVAVPPCSTRTASGCIRRLRACAGAAARAAPI